MLLIYNTIHATEPRDYFDQIAQTRLFPDSKFATIYLGSKLADCQKYTHLLLTGSELSASQGSKYDTGILAVIAEFVQARKPVLGICHGHQMLARYLAGDEYCRRAIVPEFGFKKMQITDDILFTGIQNPIFLESRYDEVFDLPSDFGIIAANETEAVQGFRYLDLPVWGIQFHPEFLFEDGDTMLQKHLNQNPADRQYYRNDLRNADELQQNLKIFTNFFLSR
ncbi:MAG: gamma-glutamyl-gamma-aminobutyrate hydrolase family protein [Candidatus Cloacimonetes bacterium]|nr:gamma-glutamyl-gamma-aminobutyrate hydrolase family protein [Candidatus Cloacimonadota bacterium]